ncbi:hypothetical protein ACFL5D_02770 [Candidatus Neomarinimicrobiota bacterium]
MIIMLSTIYNTGCTHSVTRYRLQREPIYDTIPVTERKLVISNYVPIPSVLADSTRICSIVFLPFEGTKATDSTKLISYNINFKKMFINHSNYSNRFILYDDKLVSSLLGTDKFIYSDEAIQMINSKLGIDNIIAGVINVSTPNELELKIYNQNGLKRFLLKDTGNLNIFEDALEIIYNNNEPIYAYDSVIIGNKTVLNGHEDSWVSYMNNEASAIKSFLFWTISTAALTTAAVIYEYDYADLLNYLDIKLDK